MKQSLAGLKTKTGFPVLLLIALAALVAWALVASPASSAPEPPTIAPKGLKQSALSTLEGITTTDKKFRVP